MNGLSRNILSFTLNRVNCRTLCCTQILNSKNWRISKGLSANRNAEGILTDGPDYTFLDGRPTPLLHKQKQRLLQQRDYAAQIVELSHELEFAKERYQNMLNAKQQERQRIIEGRLKAKGREMARRK